jgi:hypothetical protein
MQEQLNTHSNANDSIAAPFRTQDTTSIVSIDNSSRLAELESSIQAIYSECLSFQSELKGLQEEFHKVVTSALQHSKQIQAIQSDMRGLSVMVIELRNGIPPPMLLRSL